MKAVRFHAHGGPDVLRYEDAADPIPGPGEALVRVRACALNHLDLWQRRGMERVQIPFPHISGADVAGEVISAPNSEFAAGRRVMLQPGMSCGRCAACLDGRDNECPKYDVLGYRSDGGYAEIVKVPTQNLIMLPDSIGFVEAAAFPLAFLTAWHMLITRAKLRSGEDVLVLGAGSGVGQALSRCAGRGARRHCGTDEKLVRPGTWRPGDPTTPPDLPAKIREFTNGRGVDVVVEHVGIAIGSCLWSLARAPVCHLAPPMVTMRKSIWCALTRQIAAGSRMGRKGERCAPRFSCCELRRWSTRFPLAEAAEAHRRLEAREQFGKLVLAV